MEIREIYQLEEIAAKRLNTFTLLFSDFSEQENKDWELKLTKDYYACGCETGSAFLIVSMIISIVYSIYSFKTDTMNIDLNFIFTQLIVFILAAVLGKTIGLVRSKIRMKSNLKKISQSIQHRINVHAT